MCGHPDLFRSVRDLGRVPPGCSCSSVFPESRSLLWLPAWLPISDSLANRLAFRRHRPSFFRPDISPVATDRACAPHCRRSLALAVGCCCCCHRSCQPSAGCPVGSRPAPCRGWPASGPGRLPPGSCLLIGVSAESPGSSVVTVRDVRFTRHFMPVLVVLRSQSCLGWRGGHVHSAGHPRIWAIPGLLYRPPRRTCGCRSPRGDTMC
jgi:hypothetical protein